MNLSNKLNLILKKYSEGKWKITEELSVTDLAA